MSSIETNTKLLKLHLHWPNRENLIDSAEEAAEFFKWLFSNYHGLPEVEALGSVEDVEAFLKKNKHVLQAKPEELPAKPFNARIEPRIENDVQVVLSVDECLENVELVGMTSNGQTLDLGLHGMKISIDKNIPEGSILSLRLYTNDDDTFELSGETRWVRPLDGGQLMGIKLFESEGFEAWHSQFGLKFVAPKIGRNYIPKPE